MIVAVLLVVICIVADVVMDWCLLTKLLLHHWRAPVCGRRLHLRMMRAVVVAMVVGVRVVVAHCWRRWRASRGRLVVRNHVARLLFTTAGRHQCSARILFLKYPSQSSWGRLSFEAVLLPRLLCIWYSLLSCALLRITII